MTGFSPWRHVFAGSVLAITILLGVLGGQWLDGRWGTEPWGTLAGVLLGIGAGAFNFYREFMDER